MFLIVILYALFATSFPVGKFLVSHSTPIFLTGIRMFIAGIILLAYQYFFAHHNLKFKRKDFWMFAQIIFFGIYINYILRFWGLNGLSSFKTSFFFNFSPFLTSIYSYLFFGEKMSLKKWLGLSIGFFGIIPVLISSSPQELATGELFYISWQELAVFLSVALHNYSWIVMRKLIRTDNYEPMMINAFAMTTGGLMALITAFFTEGFFPVTGSYSFFGWLGFMILVSNLFCHNLYGHLLKKYSATFLSFAGFQTPLFAALYGWLFLGEAVTWHFYASTAIVITGLTIFYQEELKHQLEEIN